MAVRGEPAYPRGNLFIKYNLAVRLYFCWVDPLFCYGARHTLQHEDLYAHPPEADSEYLLRQFNKHWRTELRYYNNGGTPRMWRALAKVLWWRVIVHGILSVFLALLYVGQALILGYITDYFTIESPSSEETRDVYLLALGMTLLALCTVTNNSTNAYIGMKLGMLLRIICTSAIYQKLLLLSQSTVSCLTSGKLINLASNDVHRFDQSMLFYHFFWVGPLHLGLVTYFVYLEIGPTSFLATVLVLLQIPFQVLLANSFIKLRLRAAQKTDERVKIMNEVIIGIRVLKMYGWEQAFQRMIAYLRKKEVGIILKGSIIRAINLSYYILALPTIMFSVFSVYVSIEGTCSLTPKKVFTTFSLLTFVRLTSVNFLLKGIIQVAEGKVALKRITDLLLQDELGAKRLGDKSDQQLQSNRVYSSNPLAIELTSNGIRTDKPQLTVDSLCASWANDPDKLSLRNISFIVDRNAPLLAIVGSVGSGKSTLLQCLLGELSLTSGSIQKKGKVGYASQEPWIFSATLKDNILFGLPYDSEWYNRVIETCSLEKDIEILPQGDLTLVGERGVTLSGGQKARVSLARAVYSKPDICLLDDPLSAVDAAVSRHLFDSCIRGLLSDSSLVVLVTHQLQYIHQCDTVLGLREGNVMFCDDPSNIISSGIDFLNVIGQGNDEEKKQNLEQGEEADDPRKEFAVRKYSIVPLDLSNIKDKLVNDTQEFKLIPEEVEVTSPLDEEITSPFLEEAMGDHHSAFSVPVLTSQTSHLPNLEETHLSKENDSDKIMASNSLKLPAEERSQGNIGFKTYYKYFIAGGGHIFTLFVFLSFLVGEGTVIGSDLLISLWADCGVGNCTDSSVCRLGNNGLIGIYGGLIGSVWITCIGRTILFYVLALRAARILHNRMFNCVIRTPVLFFDTNPVGRILNRFSKDIGFIDDILIFSFCEFIQLFTRFLAIMATSIASNYYLIVLVAILMVIFGVFRWYYLQTSREIKRLEAIARSPLYSHFSMTIQGLPTIRSYNRLVETTQQFHRYHNKHTQAWDAYLVTTRWFGIRIDALSSLFVSTLFFLSILLVSILDLNRAVVGLALTYSLSLNGMFQYCIRQSAEVENYMVSVERVLSYCTLQSEGSLETLPAAKKPSPDWPEKGQLEISDLTYRHSQDGPCVLKGLNFSVKAGEKIGIVGRTGAGKSSLIASFFRLAEPQGSIVIDGVECLDIGLHDVRTKIAIIPQDPVLFSGTIRYNLDPFNNYDDDRIWRALKQVQLEGSIASLEGGLDALITEGGSNFSVGQRQLFCLSRALLKNNKILMLDEATANVDLETDSIIQQVIREQFIDCTVLTIAHRLDTVMDSDKIMVLRVGELLEYDEPHSLLCNADSYLLRLVEHTGPIAAEKLKVMALKAYKDKRD